MKMVAEVDGQEELVLEQLAGVLGDGRTPQTLRDEALTFLLSKDYPELAQYVVKVLPHVQGSTRLRDAAAGVAGAASHADGAVGGHQGLGRRRGPPARLRSRTSAWSSRG